MPHTEKLADFLVLLLPIFPLTSLGTIHGGLARRAVLELEIWRRCSSMLQLSRMERSEGTLGYAIVNGVKSIDATYSSRSTKPIRIE
jgi:hypothetical protein